MLATTWPSEPTNNEDKIKTNTQTIISSVNSLFSINGILRKPADLDTYKKMLDSANKNIVLLNKIDINQLPPQKQLTAFSSQIFSMNNRLLPNERTPPPTDIFNTSSNTTLNEISDEKLSQFIWAKDYCTFDDGITKINSLTTLKQLYSGLKQYLEAKTIAKTVTEDAIHKAMQKTMQKTVTSPKLGGRKQRTKLYKKRKHRKSMSKRR
jgi:hypothetical protein